jgi:hypothetical protein
VNTKCPPPPLCSSSSESSTRNLLSIQLLLGQRR